MYRAEIIKTGNPIVDKVAQLKITGNVIPEAWYHTIVNPKGKIQPLAILILADILYWYRPSSKRNKKTNTIRYTKKFHDKQYLQRSYNELMEKFNISRSQATPAIEQLEALGVIKLHRKKIHVYGKTYNDVMFIELVPEVLERLTFPQSPQKPYKNINPSHKNVKTIPENVKTPHKNVKTNTKITSKTTSHTSTSTTEQAVVAKATKIFKELGLSNEDILAIVKASNYNLTRCQSAKELLLQQTTHIHNITGWMISAIKKNYQPLCKTPTPKKNSFNNFHQRKYEQGELERLLLTTSLT